MTKDVAGIAVFKGTSFLYFYEVTRSRGHAATAEAALVTARKIGGETCVTTLRAYEAARAEQQWQYENACHAARVAAR